MYKTVCFNENMLNYALVRTQQMRSGNHINIPL